MDEIEEEAEANETAPSVELQKQRRTPAKRPRLCHWINSAGNTVPFIMAEIINLNRAANRPR